MKKKSRSIIERIGKSIPDPIVIFALLYVILLFCSFVWGGGRFSVPTADGEAVYEFKYMFTDENIRWIFSNAVLTNWLSYGGGILGTILVIMLGIGVAEESGLLSAIIKKLGGAVPVKLLPYMLVFLGIMSNAATDVGYLVLVPLVGMLYSSIGKNPLVGMAASFAGVSAGFSANLIPATFVDVVIGTNARSFALNQGIPFVSQKGAPLTPATMNYYFFAVSSIMLVIIGGLVTVKITEKKLASPLPAKRAAENANITKTENHGLKFALLGFLASIAVVAYLSFFPLRSYTNDNGTKVSPYLDNVILLVTFIFFTSGVFYGFATKKFKSASDVASSMAKQMGNMGYVIVLTFFCYNFLSLFSYTNADAFITGIGGVILKKAGISHSPVLLIIGVIIITSAVNLFVGGMTAKWLLLGPLFIPMLYNANSSMTPDVVAASYRLADSCTNIITPLMTYTGVILTHMRKYDKSFTVGRLINMMLPYSLIFLVSWSALLIIFTILKIPLGF